jgi:amino-acid N-acetyltransferase
VAVDPTERGRGVGTALCDALEARAAAAGVERLFLLTTTAPGFFADRGYAVVDRADVPETIGTTAQFADLCPDAATVMSTSL